MATLRRLFKPWLMLLIAALAATAGCGSDTNAGSDTEADGSTATEGEAFASPLFEALGVNEALLNPNNVAAQQGLQLALNDQVQACMTAEGFDWQPSPATDALFGGADSFDGLEPESLEWAERYGFGVSTLVFQQDQVGPDLVGNEFFSIPEGESDPNAEYLAGLSESDRGAYDEALFGDADLGDLSDESEEEIAAAQMAMMTNPTGCLPTAQNEVFGTDFFTALQEFGPDIEALYDSVFADARIAELEDEIATCVADEGLDYIPSNEVGDHFFAMVQPLMSGQQLLDPTAEAQMLEEDQLNELADIQQAEIDLAVVMHGCTDDSTYDETFETVRLEYEEKFVADNQSRIDGLGSGG